MIFSNARAFTDAVLSLRKQKDHRRQADNLVGRIEVQRTQADNLVGKIEVQRTQADNLVGRLEVDSLEVQRSQAYILVGRLEVDILARSLEVERRQAYMLVCSLEVQRSQADMLEVVRRRPRSLALEYHSLDLRRHQLLLQVRAEEEPLRRSIQTSLFL